MNPTLLAILIPMAKTKANTPLFAAGKHSNALSGNLTQIAYLALGAIFLAFFTYLATIRLNAKRDLRKRLAWEATTDRGLVAVSSQIRNNVRIIYGGEEVTDLIAVKCRITNTGNQVLRGQRLRFAFPEGTRVLEAGFSPVPEPELQCTEMPVEAGKPTDRSYVIGHMEVGQHVSFEFVAAGATAADWKIHPFNEDGDVKLQQREVSRIKDEQEHVRPFLIILTALVMSSVLIHSLEATNLFIYDIVAIVIFLVQLTLALMLVPHVRPMAQISSRLIDRWLADSESTASITIQGGNNSTVVAATGTIDGGITVHSDAESEPHVNAS